jgi:amino acid transporter
LGVPFIEIFYNSVKSVGGAIGMSVVVLILTWGCATGITTSASRMTWSFARDGGMPFSRNLREVSRSSQIPAVAIIVVTIFAALLVLIFIGSSYVKFSDVISLTITGFYGSYFLPCAFLLYHRVKGDILPYRSQFPQGPEQWALADETLDRNPEIQATLDIDNEFSELRLVWGPWRLPGVFGIINNAYACVYMIFVIFWSVWPSTTPVFSNTMNYSIVVTGGVMILSSVWYVVRGNQEYSGPVDEIRRRGGSDLSNGGM